MTSLWSVSHPERVLTSSESIWTEIDLRRPDDLNTKVRGSVIAITAISLEAINYNITFERYASPS